MVRKYHDYLLVSFVLSAICPRFVCKTCILTVKLKSTTNFDLSLPLSSVHQCNGKQVFSEVMCHYARYLRPD